MWLFSRETSRSVYKGLTQEINGDGGSIWWAPGAVNFFPILILHCTVVSVRYTWPILQVNFCCLWVIFFLAASRRQAFTCLTRLACKGQSFVFIALVSCVLKHATWHECCRDRTLVHSLTIKPRHTGTRLFLTPHFYEQFALSLRKESPYIFSKFNPLNTDTLLIRRPP